MRRSTVTEVSAVNDDEGRVDAAAEFDAFYTLTATRVMRQLVLLTGDVAEAWAQARSNIRDVGQAL